MKAGTVRPRSRRASQRGTSMIEVLVAMTLAVTVMATLMGTFIAFGRAERRQADAIDRRQDMRRALDETSAALRSAASWHPAPGPDAARAELTFTVPDDGSGWTTRRVRVDADRAAVVLETLSDPDGGKVIDARLVLGEARRSDQPFLRYFGPDGGEILPNEVEPKQLAACTVRVRVTLGDRGAEGGPDSSGAADMSIDVTLRNVSPEDIEC